MDGELEVHHINTNENLSFISVIINRLRFSLVILGICTALISQHSIDKSRFFVNKPCNDEQSRWFMINNARQFQVKLMLSSGLQSHSREII